VHNRKSVLCFTNGTDLIFLLAPHCILIVLFLHNLDVNAFLLYTGLHRMHLVHKMWPVGTDVACSMVCVCVLVIWM